MQSVTAPEQKPNRRGAHLKGKGWPKGTSGNPAGRKPKSPEQRAAEAEAKRLAERAKDRAVADVQAELKAMVGPALDKLRELVNSDDPGIALRACTDIVSRVNGQPVATTLMAAHVQTNDGRPDVLQGPELQKHLAGLLAAAQAKGLALLKADAIDAEVLE